MNNTKFWIIIYFIALIIVGSLGYYFIGGSDWTLLDSLYMTIITLASVGYGEVHTLDNYGKIWSILLIIFGVTGVGALFRTINEEFIQSQLFWKNKMKKTISKLKNHYIICGYGRMGAVIAKELSEKGKQFVIIDYSEDKIEEIREKGMLGLKGDANQSE